jgi:uncharacterized membrane protein
VKRRWAIFVAMGFVLVVLVLLSPDRWWRTAIAVTLGGLTIVIVPALIRLDELMANDQRRPTPAQWRSATRIGIQALIVIAPPLTIVIAVTIAALK